MCKVIFIPAQDQMDLVPQIMKEPWAVEATEVIGLGLKHIKECAQQQPGVLLTTGDCPSAIAFDMEWFGDHRVLLARRLRTIGQITTHDTSMEVGQVKEETGHRVFYFMQQDPMDRADLLIAGVAIIQGSKFTVIDPESAPVLFGSPIGSFYTMEGTCKNIKDAEERIRQLRLLSSFLRVFAFYAV